jgi:calcium-dependent protein kinase
MDISRVFIFERNIGGGHFGSVHIAHPICDPKRKFAIKTISKSKISERSRKRLEIELDILGQMDHPNIVKYLGTFVNNQYIHIVMELCKGGEVFERIQKFGSLNEYSAAKVIH